MEQMVSKAAFKPKALAYLRRVQRYKQPLVITHQGKPVVKIVPYTESSSAVLRSLRGSVIAYEGPTEPVDESWEVLG